MYKEHYNSKSMQIEQNNCANFSVMIVLNCQVIAYSDRTILPDSNGMHNSKVTKNAHRTE